METGVVLPRQPRAGAEDQDGAASGPVPGVGQSVGIAGHRRAATTTGRLGAAEGGGAHRWCGGYMLL
jgi:hypothetical protein